LGHSSQRVLTSPIPIGYVDSQASIIIGLILGFGSYFSVWLLKHKLRFVLLRFAAQRHATGTGPNYFFNRFVVLIAGLTTRST
jgi:hypothetical protein